MTNPFGAKGPSETYAKHHTEQPRSSMTSIRAKMGGRTFEGTLEEATVGALKSWLVEQTGLHDTKILYKGRVDQRDDSCSLAEAGVPPGATVMVMGVPSAERLSAMNQAAAAAASSASRPGGARPRPRPQRSRPAHPEHAQYTFNELRTLPLPRADEARRYLERLRDDAGIRGIMAKYRWTVPVLSELDPATNTGHDRMYLGFNVGAGAEIQLRLRTDDYSGFRHYRTVRYALLHELTHNVHGEHDFAFHRFLNQLERDVVALDPYGAPGHALATDGASAGPLDESDPEVQEQRRALVREAALRRQSHPSPEQGQPPPAGS